MSRKINYIERYTKKPQELKKTMFAVCWLKATKSTKPMLLNWETFLHTFQLFLSNDRNLVTLEQNK